MAYVDVDAGEFDLPRYPKAVDGLDHCVEQAVAQARVADDACGVLA